MASKELDFEFLDTTESGEEELGTLGNYRVLKEIGRGGMGFVLLAQDKRLERMVALKVMNKKVAGSPGSRKRFLSEARAMAAVHHDNVATIFEVGEVKRTPFMAMELLEGGTLEKYNERFGQPDFKKIIRIARDIARGLSAAHARGIVHRDIKPANIWYNDKLERIKILDFGLALAQSPNEQLASLGAVVGTPGYLSPEQARSEPLDDRSDLYAVGVVLYELATGQLPLKATTVAEQLIAILTHAPTPVRQHNSNIPEPLAALIERLMSKEARDRVQSADHLQDLLDQVEKDCESKTEVAQAINQLAQGLQQAVTKKQTPAPSTKPVAGITPAPVAAAPDLSQTLQSLPNPTAANAASITSGTPHYADASGGSGYVPAMRPQQAHKRPQNKTKAGPNAGLIGGLIGLAVVAIAAIGIGIYLYAGKDKVAETNEQNSSQTNNQQNNSPPRTNQNKPKPNNNANKPNRKPNQQQPNRNTNNPKPQQPAPAKFTYLAASSANSNQLDSPTHTGQTMLINDRKGNGSFEEGTQNTGAANIPGWTIKKSGKSGGWFKFNRQQDQQTLTQAFAGPASQIVLQSTPLAYQCKSGDVFRISFSMGGNGQGQTEYRVLMALTGSDGKQERYQIADIKTPANGGKTSRAGYDFPISQVMANKKPQLIIEITNPTQTRKRAILDRVVLSVDKAATKTAGPPKPKPATDPKTTTPKNQPVVGGQKLVFQASKGSGADAAVSKSGGNAPLGAKPNLHVQTRENRQIQHSYIRFDLSSLRPKTANGQNNNQPSYSNQSDYGNQSGSGNQGNQPPANRPVLDATLKLPVFASDAGKDTVLQVYGINDATSDKWPEELINWKNSYSETNLQKAKLLAEKSIAGVKAGQTITIKDKRMTDLAAGKTIKSVTLILKLKDGTHRVSFPSKEKKDSPQVSLELTVGK